MRIIYLFRILLLHFTLLHTFPVAADWLNLTGAETAPNIAEIYILEDHIRVQMEIYPDDLEIFKDLIPDDWLSNMRTFPVMSLLSKAIMVNHCLPT